MALRFVSWHDDMLAKVVVFAPGRRLPVAFVDCLRRRPDRNGPAVAQIVWVTVDKPWHRQHLMTRMYEALARLVCRAWRLPLSSDFSRTVRSDAFWRKQHAKGRADCIRDGGADADPDFACARYQLHCPPPASLEGFRRKS